MFWVAVYSLRGDVLVIHFADKTQLGLALRCVPDPVAAPVRPTPCDPQLLVKNLLHSPVFNSGLLFYGLD